MISRSNGSWSHMEMKSPEVSIHFAFCSSVSLCITNREQIFHLHRSSRTVVCAVSLLIPNSFKINLSISRRSYASICRTFSIISGVLFVDGQTEHLMLSSFPSLCKSVWTICKHIFCSQFPSRTPVPTFHESPLQFSPICSRSRCLHVAPLCCDTALILTTFNWLQSVYTAGHMQSMLCIDSPHVSEEHVHVHTYAPSCHSDMTPFTELLRHAFYASEILTKKKFSRIPATEIKFLSEIVHITIRVRIRIDKVRAHWM